MPFFCMHVSCFYSVFSAAELVDLGTKLSVLVIVSCY